jgi:hypothetical protein
MAALLVERKSRRRRRADSSRAASTVRHDHPQRSRHGQPAEPDVGKVRFAVDADVQGHVRPGRLSVLRLSKQHAAAKPIQVEAQCLQRGAQQQIMLEAPSTAAPANKLLLQRVDVQPYGDAEECVEILERDPPSMPEMNCVQGFERRFLGPTEAYPTKILVEVDD